MKKLLTMLFVLLAFTAANAQYKFVEAIVDSADSNYAAVQLDGYYMGGFILPAIADGVDTVWIEQYCDDGVWRKVQYQGVDYDIPVDTTGTKTVILNKDIVMGIEKSRVVMESASAEDDTLKYLMEKR